MFFLLQFVIFLIKNILNYFFNFNIEIIKKILIKELI